MSVRYRLSFFLFAITVVTVVGRLETGSLRFLASDFWYAAGLLLLILLSVIDQPHFSKDANVFVNGITGLVALLTVPLDVRNGVWSTFFFWSFYLVGSSYALMMIRAQPLAKESDAIRIVSRINRTIGKPEALFSAFFIWGLLTQFGVHSDQFRVLMWFWGVFTILNVPAISSSIAEFFEKRTSPAVEVIGVVSKTISPRIAEIRVISTAPRDLIGKHTLIVSAAGTVCAHATVIDDRVMSHVRVATVAVTEEMDAWGSLAMETEKEVVLKLAPLPEITQEMPISFVDRGSDIGHLCFYLNPQVAMQEGEVIWVMLPTGERAYYQVVAAAITQERSEPPHQIQELRVIAGQLGIWNSTNSRFEPIQWVAPAGELIFKVSGSLEEERHIPNGHVQVGSVPNSTFPIHVSLDDIVTHNSAIIGVTGSGKSYLSFRLVEALVAAGIKVLILDLTRQHWAFLQHLAPQAIRTNDELKNWLASNGLVGVHQFATATSYPAQTALFVETTFKHFEAGTALVAGGNEPARLCLLLEEAHSLIPEWNQVAADDDKRHVNKTARIILQGRKYGLGCIIVTQRTANVTKTILNQCNTIFALQSFDQTGLDFLRNYMGEAYAHAISTLPTRHGILVGKASSSARPVLFGITDFGSRWPVAVVADPAPPVDAT